MKKVSTHTSTIIFGLLTIGLVLAGYLYDKQKHAPSTNLEEGLQAVTREVFPARQYPNNEDDWPRGL